MAELSNPHDHFFRELLSQQETVRDFLRYYLPVEVVPLLDLSSPKLLKDSFIDPGLQEHFSDLLYQVALRKGGSPAYVYVLFEHKSYPDPMVAFQLLRYMVRIWERDQKHRTKLVPIMPVVLYHGEARWKIAPNLQAVFRAPPELAPYLPDYRYWLCDLSQYSDEQIKGEMMLRVGLLTLKYILRDDLREHLVDILSLLRQLSPQQTGLEYLETVLRYLAGGTSKIDDEELWKAVATAFPKGEAIVGTIAEKWVEQGLQRGRQEGRQETLKALRQILTIRFDAPPPEFERRLEPLELPVLGQLITAGLTLPTLAEFEQAMAGALEAHEPALEKTA
jgi:predicted transposase/invertase (TIGR01784 family)